LIRKEGLHFSLKVDDNLSRCGYKER